MTSSKSIRIPRLFLGLILSMAVGTSVIAMPPHQDMLARKSMNGEALPYFLEKRPELLSAGINSAYKFRAVEKSSYTGSFNALAILVRFSDKTNSVPAHEFDTLIFLNQQGSVRHYYREISYDQFDIVTVNLPSSLGWQTAPQTYAYYCNNQNGTGSYPQNSQKLCEDLVDLIDPVVDFSQYDNDGDGYVDAVVIVHTGPGAEFTGADTDIWSHQWSIFPRLKDGVRISDYCIQPEYWQSPGDITCGVYCHELGHVLGLPDLYDRDYPTDSYGVGRWSLMSYGSWNGPGGMGGSPAHLDAWCRIRLGFAGAMNLTSNLDNCPIDAVETGGNIYRLWSSGAPGSEYFLVENRQKTGYDSYLTAAGLFIWHIDESQLISGNWNDNQWYPGHTSSGNFLVALEQADGDFDLEKAYPIGNSADNSDPYPGTSLNTDFGAMTLPNSNSYDGDLTYVAVENISASGPNMTADLKVSIASGFDNQYDLILPRKPFLSQNYPNPFNPVTRIDFTLYRETAVSIDIFDVLGNHVRRLAEGRYPFGSYTVEWDGTNQDGQPVASGIYLYRLKTDQGEESRKMGLIK